ncbi:ABC transporter substrate-binding protein [Rhizorhabdus argentea]|uniref:ABC transporter substrate-binding protein n=1 Tax=Rhizorhabdus argentea TaxID=1387174 RepID=UPI0030EEDC0C
MMIRTIAAGLMLSIAVPAVAGAIDPAARISAYNEGIVALLKARLGLQARRDRFETLVREFYDMPAIAQLVVGPKWSTSTPVDRNAAIAALTRHSAVTLARNFVAFRGEAFTVDPAVIDRGTNKIVRVRITAPGSSDTLLYVLRQSADGWKIVDVISEGVSQLAVQRADFAASVASEGAGGLARRLAKLDAATR